LRVCRSFLGLGYENNKNILSFLPPTGRLISVSPGKFGNRGYPGLRDS
jgi:hypothetical protein